MIERLIEAVNVPPRQSDLLDRAVLAAGVFALVISVAGTASLHF